MKNSDDLPLGRNKLLFVMYGINMFVEKNRTECGMNVQPIWNQLGEMVEMDEIDK